MKTLTIHESRDELLRLRSRFEGTECYPRIRMLLKFLDEPARSMRSIATELTVPESTLRRWKNLYRRSGLEGLLEFKGRGNRPVLSSPPACSEKEIKGEEHPFLSSSIYNFLNNFPVVAEPMEWSRLMQAHLVRSFDEIDYALVCVSLIDTQHPERNRNGMAYRQIGLEDVRTGKTVYRSGTAMAEPDRPRWKKIVEDFRQMVGRETRGRTDSGKKTGEPIGFDYFLQPESPTTYMGSIVLLRDVRREGFPSSLIRLMENLYPFFCNQFLHHINAVNLRNPRNLHLKHAAGMIGEKLTNREQDVLMLLLHGHSYHEIADALNIADKTVTSHVHQIYRKTGVSRLSELFARYVTLRCFDGDQGVRPG